MVTLAKYVKQEKASPKFSFNFFFNGLCIHLLAYPYASMGGGKCPLDTTNTQRHTCQMPLNLLCLYQALLELSFKKKLGVKRIYTLPEKEN